MTSMWQRFLGGKIFRKRQNQGAHVYMHSMEALERSTALKRAMHAPICPNEQPLDFLSEQRQRLQNAGCSNTDGCSSICDLSRGAQRSRDCNKDENRSPASQQTKNIGLDLEAVYVTRTSGKNSPRSVGHRYQGMFVLCRQSFR